MGEMGVGDFQARLEAALTGTQIPAGPCPVFPRFGAKLAVGDAGGQMFVLREAKDVEVVVFDNLHALVPIVASGGARKL